jgi:5-phospho-D-xylono-1,4-lactonase
VNANLSSKTEAAPRLVKTVLGDIPYETLGITDAHNHAWIDPIPGSHPSAPVLNRYDLILKELREYRSASGRSLLDCQPGGCGRNGGKLCSLSEESEVNIIAACGFHLRKYYPADYWLFSAPETRIADHLLSEYLQGLEECRDMDNPPRAGFFKIALEATWKDCPQAGLEACAAAAAQTGGLVEVHTEKGALAEKAVIFFTDRGVAPHQLVLCHMDKRPDIGLQSEIAKYGPLVEYDTFYRPKYEPEAHLWPLIKQMAELGHGNRVALATDMAESAMYHAIGGGPGLKSLPDEIQNRLVKYNIPEKTIRDMLGGNIARRLAGLL